MLLGGKPPTIWQLEASEVFCVKEKETHRGEGMKFFKTLFQVKTREILEKMSASNELLSLEPLFWGSVDYTSLALTQRILEIGNRNGVLILYKYKIGGTG